VTPYIYQNPGLFRLLSIRADGVYGAYRWTVDTPEDLDYVRSIYQKVGHPDAFGWKDAIRVLAQEPELMKLNRHVRQKTLEEG
jgi:spore coat polysaccharide biosynthesis protein SpsF